MSIVGQPQSYSDILKRVFYSTLIIGIVCSVLLAAASPTAKAILDSLSQDVDVGPIKGLKALYVLIPTLIAVVSRICLLHDKISSLLRIRQRFDVNCILVPLATGVGLTNDNRLRAVAGQYRMELMDSTFYIYASFSQPQISTQLVHTAADNWGWFWVSVEGLALALPTLVFLAIVRAWPWAVIAGSLVVLLMLVLLLKRSACRQSAERQTRAILSDDRWRAAIRSEFDRRSIP